MCLSMSQLTPVPNYAAWWQGYLGVNNLPRVVTLPRADWGIELATCGSYVWQPTIAVPRPSIQEILV